MPGMTTSVAKAGGDTVTAANNNALRADIVAIAGDYVTTGGSANAYTASIDATFSAYGAGKKIRVKANFTNTSAATMNVNSIGARNIKKNVNQALEPGDMTIDGIYDLEDDGTNFQLLNPSTRIGFALDGVITLGTLSETFSATDISTNNLNLAYQDPTTMKWGKVTSTTSTWYHRLGLVLESGVNNDVVRILLKGRYGNQNFSNINPTFSGAGTGTDNNVGDAAATIARAFAVSNTGGAEAVLSGAGSIRVKKQGTPTNDLQIKLVLQQTDQASTPACFSGSSTVTICGAVIATATIDKATITGSYQTLNFTLSATLGASSIRIPAGCTVYLVFDSQTISASNYYVIDGSGSTLAQNGTTHAFQWGGTTATPTYSLTVTSTSPVGYAVKAYTGTNGSYGLSVSSNPWSRVIGRVLSTTEIYFDPDFKRVSLDDTGWVQDTTGATIATDIVLVTTNFCPSEVDVLACVASASGGTTADKVIVARGGIRGDKSQSTSNNVTGPTTSFLAPAASYTSGAMCIGVTAGAGSNFATASNCRLHIVRMENGIYVYSGYPNTAAISHTPYTNLSLKSAV